MTSELTEEWIQFVPVNIPNEYITMKVDTLTFVEQKNSRYSYSWVGDFECSSKTVDDSDTGALLVTFEIYHDYSKVAISRRFNHPFQVV